MIRKTVSIRPDFRRLMLLGSTLLVAGALLVAAPARSQQFQEILDPAELEDLVAPVALYPDDVLGIVMAASTFPLDIVRAARFLDELEVDPTLEPDEDWDESVIALLNYPEILRMMNEDLDWTWALGEAVLTDETAVLAAAQTFRSRALAAGNLRSDEKQIVAHSGDAIEIRPADPKVVYIPVYEPREVVVYHSRPIYRYYPVGYPVYYYPYPSGYFYPGDFFWGVTSYFSIGWHSHHLHVHHHSHRLHPYYLHSFYFHRPYYVRSNVIVTVNVDSHPNVWRPSPRRGVRPRTVTTEGRTSIARTRTTTTTESQPGLSRTRPSPVQGGIRSSGVSTRSSVNTSGTTTRRAGLSDGAGASGSVAARERPGAVIGGRVERSAPAERSVPARTRTVPSTSTSPSQIRGIRSGSADGTTGTTRRPTRVPTPAPNTSTRTRGSPVIGGVRRGTQAAPAPSPAPRAQGATRSSTRSAPSPSAPRTRTRQPR